MNLKLSNCQVSWWKISTMSQTENNQAFIHLLQCYKQSKRGAASPGPTFPHLVTLGLDQVNVVQIGEMVSGELSLQDFCLLWICQLGRKIVKGKEYKNIGLKWRKVPLPRRPLRRFPDGSCCLGTQIH